jgi:hypothetical protein
MLPSVQIDSIDCAVVVVLPFHPNLVFSDG